MLLTKTDGEKTQATEKSYSLARGKKQTNT